MLDHGPNQRSPGADRGLMMAPHKANFLRLEQTIRNTFKPSKHAGTTFDTSSVPSSIRHDRTRRRSLLRSIVATVWVWSCIVPHLLYAAAPQERTNEPGGGAAPRQPTTASAPSAKSAVVTTIMSNINVDGLLDEREWQTAPKIGDLTQREPQTGEEPTEQTNVTLLHNADFLYIGVTSYDSDPERVIGTQMVRDANLNSDDRIEIVLDTYNDQRNAFYFATNPAGALVDGLVFANGQSNLQWDSIWTVRTRRTSEGWTAEFAIPFKSLSFPSGRTVWGFNIARYIQRKLEDDRWSGARLELEFFQVSEAGQITIPESLTQGIGLDVRPFMGGSWLHTGATGRDTVAGKPGLDVSYNVTSSLKLTATLNTDFGETEVDARQINLSRFSLFFPEKRSFFLEGAGVFSFSNTGREPPGRIPPTRSETIPFFSRRIGLLSGEEVPVDFGVKLTGTVGRTDVGVLDVRTRDRSLVPAKNFLVGRVKRNFLQQSYVGAIVTSGNPAVPQSSTTFGADARLATSRFLGKSRNLAVNLYGLRSVNEGTTEKDLAYGVSAEYPNDLMVMQFFWREVQENFRPALGFVSRRNVRMLRIGGDYNPRPADFLGLQQTFNGVYYTRFTRLDNDQVESWQFHFVVPIDWHFKSGDAVHNFFNPRINFERLFAPFEISPGIVLSPGEYRFTRYALFLSTAAKRRWQLNAQWVLGTYWSGYADEVNTTFTYKIPPGVTMSVTANQTFAKLPEGTFVARIMSTRVDYAASPFLSFSNLIQYDNRSRNLGWQSRIRWILQPGNDLFFVFNQGWVQDPTGGYRFSAEDGKVSAKLQYTFRM